MDELHRFLFEGLPVRGMLVRLGESWRELLRRRDPAHGGMGAFAAPVRALLGEMAAAGALMQSNIKFDGALVLQMHGDGPVKLAVVEVQPDLAYRATAKVDGDVPPDARLEALLDLHGRGRCAITLDPKRRLPGQQPYQGVVPLRGADGEPLQHLAQALEHYMRQSEQLDTRLMLAADDRVAAGLLVQRLPAQGAGHPGARRDDEVGAGEHFNRIAHLAATLTRDELLSLDVPTVLRRLFWQETLRRFEPLRPRFACTCSRERVGRMLIGLGRAEVDDLLCERGEAEVGCDFCGRHYRFDAVDVGELFTPPADQPPTSASVQ